MGLNSFSKLRPVPAHLGRSVPAGSHPNQQPSAPSSLGECRRRTTGERLRDHPSPSSSSSSGRGSACSAAWHCAALARPVGGPRPKLLQHPALVVVAALDALQQLRGGQSRLLLRLVPDGDAQPLLSASACAAFRPMSVRVVSVMSTTPSSTRDTRTKVPTALPSEPQCGRRSRDGPCRW